MFGSIFINFIFSLIIVPKVFDAGTVSEGTIVNATFYLVNDENEPLFIKSIKPSCGCTYVAQIDRPIGIGDTITISASFNTTGYSGLVHQNIKVLLKDGRSEILTIKANVIKTSLSADELLRYLLVIIDLRDRDSFEKEHLIGAIWMNRETFEKQFSKLPIPKNTLIVLIGDENKDRFILEWLNKQGFGNVYFLKGGFDGWKARMKKTFILPKED
ncbi:MAG: DUF1573 domain-containing protein [candidate division WOR-3 bacterium]